jgi:hypothetical protein
MRNLRVVRARTCLRRRVGFDSIRNRYSDDRSASATTDSEAVGALASRTARSNNHSVEAIRPCAPTSDRLAANATRSGNRPVVATAGAPERLGKFS